MDLQAILELLNASRITVDGGPVTSNNIDKAISGLLFELARSKQENAALWTLVKSRMP
jgi:hypothetical protein